MHLRCVRILAVLCCLASLARPASAQQTGSISGKAVDTGGGVLPGVTVEARVRRAAGPARDRPPGAPASIQLPALPPGKYTVTFTLSGDADGDAQGAGPAVAGHRRRRGAWRRRACRETVNVTASATLIDKETASITSGLSNEQISRPAGRAGISRPDPADSGGAVHAGHRPAARAPAAAARTTSTSSTASTSRCRCSARCRPNRPRTTSPRSRSIKGGARAVDFDRSGGFSIDSVSKSGTSRYCRPVQLSVPDREHGGRPHQRRAVAATRRTAAGSTPTSAGRC